MDTTAVFEKMSAPPLFPLGTLVATPDALEAVPEEEITDAIARHAQGEWGDIDEEDTRANRRALQEETKLLSSYKSKSGTKFWVITEANSFVTTVQLPEDN